MSIDINNPQNKALVFVGQESIYSYLVLRELLKNETIASRLKKCFIVREPGGTILKKTIPFLRTSHYQYAWYLFLVNYGYRFLAPGKFSFQNLVQAQGIPLTITYNINSTQNISALKTLSPHLLITAYCSQKLSTEILSTVKYAINCHPSLLPGYRGVEPLIHLQENPKEIGFSFHLMNNRFDAGDILFQKRIVIYTAASSLFAQYARLWQEMGPALCNLLLNFGNFLQHRAKQEESKSGYVSVPDRKAVGTFLKRNKLFRLKDLYSLI